MKRITVILTICTVLVFNVKGQDKNAVIDAYNNGVKLIQTDVPGAIAAFENVVTMSDKVGADAADLKQKAIQVLPGLYLKNASDMLNQKKPAADVIRSAKKAVAAADKYQSQQTKENANKVLVLAYSRMATDYFAAKDYDKSLATFDSLLAVNPDYLPAIYNKALVYRAENKPDDLEKTVDMYLSKLPATDQDKKKQASQMALEYFRAEGSKANQANKLEDALNLLNKAAKYGDDKDLNYFFADVYNKQKNFDKGADYAKKGLDMETGTAEAKAKFYFQLGLAQEGQGKTADACASFQNAMFGPFAAPSKAKRTNLKCK